jgi:hypothetical protein
VILSVLATVAVNSLQPRVESARFEQTRKLMGTIQTAVAGPRDARQADGTPLISGFVADIGRLPRVVAPRLSSSLPGLELSELWDENSQLARNFPFQFRNGPASPVDYSDVRIPCGWRGPYLQLPPGDKRIRDAWGRPFELRLAADSVVEGLIWNPSGNFDSEMRCSLNTAKASVSGTLQFADSVPSSIEVVLLGPDPDTSLNELAVFADEDDDPRTFAFSDVAVGLRALHVRYDDRQLIRYLQVSHPGLTLSLQLAGSGESP